ncbi:RICIN domain-containing protein [Streptomyces geranii]|uniref:RICIN domain-containing protein n=1 Tax=Streptomyces geranii TaxID=2058923 RepID=UPI000D03140A|nr:RICIN domain-containing protein [Streptomyces geranii]
MFFLFLRRSTRHFARVVPVALSIAVLSTVAARPELAARYADDSAPMTTVADSYDGFDSAAAQQLRQDQCLMADALRIGGAGMFTTAQNALDQTPDKLRTAANREYWNDTPLATAFKQDKAAADKEGDALYARLQEWKKPVAGLPTPGGFKSVADFQDPPGLPGSEEKSFHSQTGLSQWIYDQFWKTEGDLYEDPTPSADAATLKAVKDLGTPLYGQSPSASDPDWNRAYAEHQAWDSLVNWSPEPTGSDNARLFLASGGFPRTAAEPGSVEYRLAVEDLKTRFAACGWRGPVDPNKVLGKQVAAASAEWQQEIASQAAPRNQILNANRDAVKALAAGSKALGEMLGQSWIADHLTRWQSYWSAGGPGWIGDSPMVIHANGAADKCLEVAGAGKTNGSLVQIYTCNGGAGQKWQIRDDSLVNVNSGKCLDVKSSGTANGTAVQIWTCNGSAAQKWEYDTHGTTRLFNTGTGNCLDLATYDNSRDGRMWDCKGTVPQKFDITPSGHQGTDSVDYPTTAQFTRVKAGIAAARAASASQLAAIKAQAATAKKAATASDTATQAAYTIADQAGAPRGRGLLVGLQKAQVTKASSAALDALVKAGETADAATRAAAGDSATIAARAVTQTAASKAAFRTAAANQAREQAKAAADAAAVQAQNAKAARDLAKAKLGETQQAEADAKAAAADARAHRLNAEREEQTARAEKETAAQKQAEAAQHRQNAEGYATEANSAKGRAEASETTARERRKDAEAARDNAKDKRDDAWDAESRADTARAKADAKEAYAQAHDADDQATASRAAADDADRHASDAESAAVSARGEANAATRAAADADAAATRAEAAAKRARSESDAAQAAKLRADAAVRTATASAADAIKASQVAAQAARTADELADEAEKHAAEARTHADVAKAEAAKAVAGAADAVGHAYTTARAAEDARNSAQQVAAPANDAIQLGSPYVTTDSAAGLAVLTGQSTKTIAEQQVAVAEAHEANAAQVASQAQSTANAATGDAKAALVLASEAAGFAAQARKSAKEAMGYSAEAAQYAAEAQQSLARTIEYDRQAGVDAAAADRAAGRAENYAKDARASADQAALDAAAARQAASAAEQAAKDARAAADRADAEATLAEEAAKDAQKYADSAQEAYESSERKGANQTVADGSGSGIDGVFYVVDKMTDAAPAKQLNECEYVPQGCTVTYELRLNITVSYYFCANPDVPATETGCPKADWVFLDTKSFADQKQEWTHHFSFGDITRIGWQALFGETAGAILYEIVLGDVAKCYHGDKSSCAWAATLFVPQAMFTKLAQAVKIAQRVEIAVKTGENAADILADLKKIYGEKGALDVADATSAAGMGLRVATSVAERSRIARGALDTKLLEQLRAAGTKIDRANTIWIVNYAKPGLPVAWLEKGTVNAGLTHIVFRHAGEFASAGIRVEDIPAVVAKALTQGTKVGTQGAGRPIYEVAFNGKVHRIAVSVGDNGFVIGANIA